MRRGQHKQTAEGSLCSVDNRGTSSSNTTNFLCGEIQGPTDRLKGHTFRHQAPYGWLAAHSSSRPISTPAARVCNFIIIFLRAFICWQRSGIELPLTIHLRIWIYNHTPNARCVLSNQTPYRGLRFSASPISSPSSALPYAQRTQHLSMSPLMPSSPPQTARQHKIQAYGYILGLRQCSCSSAELSPG